MSDVLEFTSAADGAKIRLSYAGEGSEESLRIVASGHGFEIAAQAYTYMCPSLPDFLDELSRTDAETPTLHWGTLEGEFRLGATRDALGHIFVTFRLRSPDIGSDKWWQFEGRLVLELGAMPALCRDARAFWRAAAQLGR